MTQAPHLLLVEARYYTHISDLLRQGAERAMAEAGATFEAVTVPGAFELPGAIKFAAQSGQFDGFVALGCVIRGETSHYDHVCNESTRGLQDLACRDGLAVGFGIATCENEAQALARSSPDGRDMGGKAVKAALTMVALKRRFVGVAPLSSGGGRRRRRAARLAAVQALYQLDLNPGLGAEGVVREFANHRLGRDGDGEDYGEPDPILFAEIVRGVSADRDRLDEVIAASLAQEYPLPRLETILRLLLEAGAFEIVHRPDIPPRVTMSEYVGIAHAFFEGPQPALANGVLDHLARTLRPAEI